MQVSRTPRLQAEGLDCVRCGGVACGLVRYKGSWAVRGGGVGLDITEDFLEVAARAGVKHLLDLKGVGPTTCRQSRSYVCEQELVWTFWEVGEDPEVHWAASLKKPQRLIAYTHLPGSWGLAPAPRLCSSASGGGGRQPPGPHPLSL